MLRNIGQASSSSVPIYQDFDKFKLVCMSDLMQLLAICQQEHNFKDLGRSPNKTSYDHDDIYVRAERESD